MPLALAVTELEVGPGAERVQLRQEIAELSPRPSASRLNCEGVTSLQRCGARATLAASIPALTPPAIRLPSGPGIRAVNRTEY